MIEEPYNKVVSLEEDTACSEDGIVGRSHYSLLINTTWDFGLSVIVVFSSEDDIFERKDGAGY